MTHLTVVYRLDPGDEAQALIQHPAMIAVSWSHALHDRDAERKACAREADYYAQNSTIAKSIADAIRARGE